MLLCAWHKTGRDILMHMEQRSSGHLPMMELLGGGAQRELSGSFRSEFFCGSGLVIGSTGCY